MLPNCLEANTEEEKNMDLVVQRACYYIKKYMKRGESDYKTKTKVMEWS